VDETIAESHDLMNTCVRFIKQNDIPPELAEELKNFFTLDVLQKGTLSLADQNQVYRNLPLSLQVQVGSQPRDAVKYCGGDGILPC